MHRGPRAWQELFAGRTSATLADESRVPPDIARLQKPTAGSGAPPPRASVIFPGPFTRCMTAIDEWPNWPARLGQRVEWEISITNVDKPSLDYHELRLRSRQFDADMPLWFSRADISGEGQDLSRRDIIVGADTITRIAEPRYYQNDPRACQDAVTAIAAAGCRFLVFGRQKGQGFETLSDLSLPREFARSVTKCRRAAFARCLVDRATRRASRGGKQLSDKVVRGRRPDRATDGRTRDKPAVIASRDRLRHATMSRITSPRDREGAAQRVVQQGLGRNAEGVEDRGQQIGRTDDAIFRLPPRASDAP